MRIDSGWNLPPSNANRLNLVIRYLGEAYPHSVDPQPVQGFGSRQRRTKMENHRREAVVYVGRPPRRDRGVQ